MTWQLGIAEPPYNPTGLPALLAARKPGRWLGPPREMHRLSHRSQLPSAALHDCRAAESFRWPGWVGGGRIFNRAPALGGWGGVGPPGWAGGRPGARPSPTDLGPVGSANPHLLTGKMSISNKKDTSPRAFKSARSHGGSWLA
jgi:hypothetical protein